MIKIDCVKVYSIDRCHIGWDLKLGDLVVESGGYLDTAKKRFLDKSKLLLEEVKFIQHD